MMNQTEVEKAAGEILSQPAFQKHIPSKNPLDGLFDDFSTGSPMDVGETGTYIILILLGTLVAGLLVYLFYLVFRDYDIRKLRRRSGGDDSIYRTTEGRARTHRDAIAIARQALAAGNVYQAIWIMHRLLLGVLDRNEIVRFEKWKTNSHYIAACPNQNNIYNLLVDTTQIYNDIVYAHRSTDSGTVEPLLKKIEGHLKP